MMLGWGLSSALICLSIAYNYQNYGGEYHCWLQVDSDLFTVQLVPIVILVILIFTMIEAAGNANYLDLPMLKGQTKAAKLQDQKSLTSAKIMQRTNVVIMPLVFASFLVGVLAEYEQNIPLYGTFTILNGCLGAAILVLHCSSNEVVRDKLKKVYKHLSKKE